MPEGVPVGRHAIVMLHSGDAAIDWGDGLFQLIRSGAFAALTEREISHTITGDELEVLRRSGLVAAFDERTAYFLNLPDRPSRTIE